MTADTATFDDLRDLYQEVILDHSRHPRHGRKLERFDASAMGDNPMCGDRVHLWLRHTPEGTVADIGFEARGCAISIASADLMAEVVKGRSEDEGRALFEAFRELVTTGDAANAFGALAEPLDQLRPLSGVHEYPSRVKCATLPWHALLAAFQGTKEASSE